jgi:hypothetical protein
MNIEQRPCQERDDVLDLIEASNNLTKQLIQLDPSLVGGETENATDSLDMIAEMTADTIGAECAIKCGSTVCFLATEDGSRYRDTYQGEMDQTVVELRKRGVSLFTPMEMPNMKGPELKDLVMRRLNMLTDPGLAEKMADLHNKRSPENQVTAKGYIEWISETITPVKDDETWEEFARFTNGNIRGALSLMSYFQQVFPYFRGSSLEDQQKAKQIAGSYKFEAYGKAYTGFKPANPYEITSLDFHRIANMMDPETGYLQLPMGNNNYTVLWLGDDPEDFAEWRMDDGEVIEQTLDQGTSLPAPRKPLAIEAKSSISE